MLAQPVRVPHAWAVSKSKHCHTALQRERESLRRQRIGIEGLLICHSLLLNITSERADEGDDVGEGRRR